MNILIVDDNPDIIDSLTEILSIHGYKSIQAANNAEKALRLLKKGDTQIVISDFLMPRMTGLELYTEVMKIPSPPKFILITGADPADIEETDNSKLTVLQKPFSTHLLVALIASLKNKLPFAPPNKVQDPHAEIPNVS